jgi:hypothetical protein
MDFQLLAQLRQPAFVAFHCRDGDVPGLETDWTRHAFWFSIVRAIAVGAVGGDEG